MTAQFITRNGETLALLLARPDRTTRPEMSCQLPTDIAWHPISTVESRRNYAGAMRYAMKYRTRTRTAAETTELRMWLNRLHEETVAVPSWTDRCVLTAAVSLGATSFPVHNHPIRSGGEWILCSTESQPGSGFSLYEIVVASAVSANTVTLSAGTAGAWPLGTLAFPLMFGRLSERPELDVYHPERATCDFKFQENSPFARRLNPYPVAPTLLGDIGQSNIATLPLWDIEPNWVEMMDHTEIDTIYQRIGFGRIDYAKTYDQPVRRGLKMTFYAPDRDTVSRIENFFFGRRGTTRPFMLPTFRGDMRLAADVAAGATTIAIEPSEYVDLTRPSHPGDSFIALVDPPGGVSPAIEPLKLLTYGSTTLQTINPVARNHGLGATRVSHLLMVRFAEEKLTWQYLSDGKATVTIRFLELVNDYPDGGLSLKEPVTLYDFQRTATGETLRYTSYEDSFRGHTPADFSWEDMTQGLDLDDSVTIESSPFAGNPLNDWFPFVNEGRDILLISEGNAADPTETPKLLIAAEVWEFSQKDYKATCKVLGRMLEGKFPAFLLQSLDNASIFDGPCALSSAGWTIAGTIASGLGSQTLVITSTPAHAKEDNYFAWGLLSTGAGTTAETRAIIHSTAVTGGVQLTLDRPLLKAVAGAAVTMYPGYDGSITQRASRYNDRIDHQGHPFVPDTPPNIKVLKAKQTPSGKK